MLRMLRWGSKNLRHKGGQGFTFSPMPLAISLFLSLFLLLFNVNPVLAGNVTLAWNAPTERVDGTPVTSSDIKGYYLHYGTASGNYTQTQPITGNVTTYTFTNLPNGVNYYFAVSAIDTADKESGYSTELCKTIGTTTITCVTTTIGSNNNSNLSKGADTPISGGGCGFVKNDGKGQKAKGEGLSLIIMLIITLTGIALARRRTENITATKEGVLVMNTRKISLIKIAAISFLLTIFWSASAFAQPNITSFSGSLSNGATLTITGSSFGVNGPNIVIFDDFESGTNGANIKIGAGSATIGEWTSVTYLSNTPPKYSNVHSLSGSLAFRGDATITEDNSGSVTCAYKMGFTTSDIFVSYWYYFPTTSDWPCFNNATCNNKIVWVTGSGTSDDDRVIPTNAPANKATNNYFYMFGNNSSGEIPLSPSLSMSKGKWYRFWGYLHGTADASGHEELWVASPSSEANIAAARRVNRTAQIWDSAFNGFNRVMINGFNRWCNDCAESAPTFDDVYVSIGTGARARVEIGDAATYTTSKNLTIATVTSWSDTSITATVRQGSFSNLNNAYLYVIDADGNVNENGYLLSDGGGGNTTPPPSSSSGGDGSASGGSGCGIIKGSDSKGTGSGLKAIDIGIVSLLLLLLFYKLRKLYKINFWRVLVFFIIIITIAINVEAATLEVGSGKTYSTIQAAANAANAGDTILVFPGTYNERVTLPLGKTGTAENKITFKSQTSRAAFMNGFDTGNANYLRIEGFDISYNVGGGWNGGGIWINNSSYVDIVDNYFHDIPGQAINPNWSSGATHNNIYVANNKIYRVNQGIIARGNDWLVENNDIERLVGTFYDADYTRFFGENITFRNNYFHGTTWQEICPAGLTSFDSSLCSHTDGFQTFAVNPGEYFKNVIIEGNIIRGDWYSQGIMLEGKAGTADNLIVRNNIFADAASWGIAAHGIANLHVLNNNFVNMLIHGVGFRAASDGTPTTGVVQNNIFYNGGTNYWKETTCTGCALTGGYNIITIEKNPYYKESTDLIGVNPLFVNVSGYDFHLQSGSPAIDAGTSSVAAVVTTDIEGNTRPIGAGYDIGAYEMADPNAPSVQITSPTTGNTYPSSGTYTGDLALSGTATPASGRSISSVTCTNSNGGSCVCSGTTNWTCNTSISSGQTNVNITVKAVDNNNSSGIDILIINSNTTGGGGSGGGSGNSGGDASASGGIGCGFVKDNNGKGQEANGDRLALMILLIIAWAGIAAA